MTNEELLAAIRQIVKEEVANVRAIEPLDLVVYGPDEHGRVMFYGTEEVNPTVKILTHLTIKQAAAGTIPPLTKKQLYTIMMNVGCDVDGNLQPIAGRGYGQTGIKEVDEMTPFTNSIIAQPTFFQPERHVFGPAFLLSDEDRTIGSRSEMIRILIKSVEGLGKLKVNDGTIFDNHI